MQIENSNDRLRNAAKRFVEAPRIPLRITVNRFGGRAHQIGHGPQSEAGRGSGAHSSWEGQDMPTGKVVVHVRDGKPLTALGRKLLGLASPTLVAAREGAGFDREGLCQDSY